MELMHSSASSAQASSCAADQPYHCGSSVSTSSSTLASTRTRFATSGLTAGASGATGQLHDFVRAHARRRAAAQARRQAPATGLGRMGDGGLGLAQGSFADKGGHRQSVQLGGAAQAILVLDAQAQVESVGNGGHIGPPCTVAYRTGSRVASRREALPEGPRAGLALRRVMVPTASLAATWMTLPRQHGGGRFRCPSWPYPWPAIGGARARTPPPSTASPARSAPAATGWPAGRRRASPAARCRARSPGSG